MIDKRFSKESFEKLGIDTDEARKLADLLGKEIENELHNVVEPAVREIVNRLNSMGHNLREYTEPIPVDISFRDDEETESGYKCWLRVDYDGIASTGYGHLAEDDE